MFYAWVDDKDKLKETLGLLSCYSPGVWGVMDAQQIVEHQIVLYNISNKKQETSILTPDKYIHQSQEF